MDTTGLPASANGLEVVAGDGVGNRYKAGNATPADVRQVVQDDLLVVIDARGHSLHGQGHRPARPLGPRPG